MAKSPDTTVDATVLDSGSQLFEDFLGLWTDQLSNQFEQLVEIAMFYKSRRNDNTPLTIQDVSGAVSGLISGQYAQLRSAFPEQIKEVRPESAFTIGQKVVPEPIEGMSYLVTDDCSAGFQGHNLHFRKHQIIPAKDTALLRHLIGGGFPKLIAMTPENIMRLKAAEGEVLIASTGTTGFKDPAENLIPRL